MLLKQTLPRASEHLAVIEAEAPVREAAYLMSRAAGHVGFDRRCPHDRRNMVLRPAVSSRRKSEIQTGPDHQSANGTSTRAIVLRIRSKHLVK